MDEAVVTDYCENLYFLHILSSSKFLVSIDA